MYLPYFRLRRSRSLTLRLCNDKRSLVLLSCFSKPRIRRPHFLSIELQGKEKVVETLAGARTIHTYMKQTKNSGLVRPSMTSLCLSLFFFPCAPPSNQKCKLFIIPILSIFWTNHKVIKTPQNLFFLIGCRLAS